MGKLTRCWLRGIWPRTSITARTAGRPRSFSPAMTWTGNSSGFDPRPQFDETKGFGQSRTLTPTPSPSLMICVSIGRSRHKHMLAEFAHLVEQGAELVELRLDYISTRVNIQRLLKDRQC